MLNIRDLKIDPNCLGQKMLLVEIVPVHEYKDKVRTDKVVGYRYVVALPAMAFEKLGVKIDGPQRMELSDGYAEVEFQGLEISAYESAGKVAITAKAADIAPAKKKQP